MNIYFICPVRNRTDKEDKIINKHVAKLELEGHVVREPKRDTNQEDEIGLRIVEDHEDDIAWARSIGVWWNPESEGSWWDTAQVKMAQIFMPEKELFWINTNSPDFSEYGHNIESITGSNPTYINWEPWSQNSKNSFWEMAQARMVKHFHPEKIIIVSNIKHLELTKEKSYHNVAIATHLGLSAGISYQELSDRLKQVKSS